jgi:hypothetical protein
LATFIFASTKKSQKVMSKSSAMDWRRWKKQGLPLDGRGEVEIYIVALICFNQSASHLLESNGIIWWNKLNYSNQLVVQINQMGRKRASWLPARSWPKGRDARVKSVTSQSRLSRRGSAASARLRVARICSMAYPSSAKADVRSLERSRWVPTNQEPAEYADQESDRRTCSKKP